MKSGLPYNTLSLYVAVYIYMLNIYAYARFAFLAVPVCVQNYATCHTCLLHSGTSSIPGSSEAHRAVAMLLNVVQAFVGESVSVHYCAVGESVEYQSGGSYANCVLLIFNILATTVIKNHNNSNNNKQKTPRTARNKFAHTSVVSTHIQTYVAQTATFASSPEYGTEHKDLNGTATTVTTTTIATKTASAG